MSLCCLGPWPPGPDVSIGPHLEIARACVCVCLSSCNLLLAPWTPGAYHSLLFCRLFCLGPWIPGPQLSIRPWAPGLEIAFSFLFALGPCLWVLMRLVASTLDSGRSNHQCLVFCISLFWLGPWPLGPEVSTGPWAPGLEHSLHFAFVSVCLGPSPLGLHS